MRNRSIVRCSEPGCDQAAAYKIAAPWNDTRFWELKTYGFACRDHVREILRQAETRWLNYDPVAGETVGYVGIYEFVPGRKDRELRAVELEADESSGW